MATCWAISGAPDNAWLGTARKHRTKAGGVRTDVWTRWFLTVPGGQGGRSAGQNVGEATSRRGEAKEGALPPAPNTCGQSYMHPTHSYRCENHTHTHTLTYSQQFHEHTHTPLQLPIHTHSHRHIPSPALIPCSSTLALFTHSHTYPPANCSWRLSHMLTHLS